jgi:hypothetical protein
VTDADRFRLLFGPYKAPRFRLGGTLTCELRGPVTVTGVSQAPIPWPLTRAARLASLILCGDLSKALRREAGVAVAYWWGVHRVTAYHWRRLLGLSNVPDEGIRLQHRLARRGKPGRPRQRPAR